MEQCVHLRGTRRGSRNSKSFVRNRAFQQLWSAADGKPHAKGPGAKAGLLHVCAQGPARRWAEPGRGSSPLVVARTVRLSCPSWAAGAGRGVRLWTGSAVASAFPARAAQRGRRSPPVNPWVPLHLLSCSCLRQDPRSRPSPSCSPSSAPRGPRPSPTMSRAPPRAAFSTCGP